MTLDNVIAYFKTGYRFAKETGMSATCIKNWREKGYIPLGSQLYIQDKTGGKLKACRLN